MKLFILMLFGVSLMMACENDASKIDGPVSDIVFLESFENNEQPSDAKWIVSPNLTSFAKSAPDRGGSWSLELEPGWAPQEGYAERYVTVPSGTGTYTLSAWIKGKGYILVGVWNGEELISSKRVENQSDDWRQISVSDNFTIRPTDKIFVKLSAGMTEVASWKALFDLVELERTPSLN